MPTLNFPLHTSVARPNRRTRARILPNALPSKVTPRSITNPLTRSVVMRPPTRDSASSTRGSSPRSFKRMAAPSPAMPPPTTITSASLLCEPMKILLPPRPREEIDGLVAACILHVVEAFVQELVPILTLGHVMDDRAEDDVVMRVPAMFEEENFSAGLQDASSFTKEFFARAARGNLVRAETEANGVARRIRQRHGEVVRLVRDNSRVACRRQLQVAHILYGLFGRFALHVPAIHRLNGGFRQHVREQESMAVRANMQIRDVHFTFYAAQVDEPADVAHSRMPVHAIQTEQGISEQYQSEGSQQHSGIEGHRHMKQDTNCAERNSHGEKLFRNSPVITAADVDGAFPRPPRGWPLFGDRSWVPV